MVIPGHVWLYVRTNQKQKQSCAVVKRIGPIFLKIVVIRTNKSTVFIRANGDECLITMTHHAVCLDCLGDVIPRGNEVDYLYDHFRAEGLEVDDVELHPRQRAIIWFRTDYDRDQFARRGLGRRKGRSLAGMISQGFSDWWYGSSVSEESEIADYSIPGAVQRAVHIDSVVSKELSDQFGAICIKTHVNGAILRGPKDRIGAAYRYLQTKYQTLFNKDSTRTPRSTSTSTPAARDKGVDMTVHGSGIGPKTKPRHPRRDSKDPKEFEMIVSRYTMDYIKKKHASEYDKIKVDYDLVLDWHGSKMDSSDITVTITTRNRRPGQLRQGYEKIRNLYGRIHYTLDMRKMGLLHCQWSEEDLKRKVLDVEKRFPWAMVTWEKPSTSRLPDHLIIIGSTKEIEKVAQLLRGAMIPKADRPLTGYQKDTDVTSSSSSEADPSNRFDRAHETPAPLAGADRTSVKSGHYVLADRANVNPVPLEGNDYWDGARRCQGRFEDIELDEVMVYELTPTSPKVLVYQGSIVDQNVQALVNAADRGLRHEGGVAYSISQAAGPGLQRQCSEYTRKNGYLRYGEVAVSSGHNLPMSYIFHAAGPRKALPNAEQLLEDTCFNLLRLAQQYNVQSIALPTISTGRFLMTKEEFAVAFCDAFLDHMSYYKEHSLKVVCIVDVDVAAILDICDSFDSILKPKGANKKVVPRKEMEHMLSKILPGTRRATSTKPRDVIGGEGMDMDVAITGSKVTPSSGPLLGPELSASVRVRSAPTVPSVTHDSEAADTMETCPICLYSIMDPKSLPNCTHRFCKECIDKAIERKAVCPVCNDVLEVRDGHQPDGNMTCTVESFSLPGYSGKRTYQITYHFPDGIQTENHPNPGVPYTGTTRYAFLPKTTEGKEVLRLLSEAFKRKLLFAIGTSITSGRENVVVWNDIHQKTRIDGGPTCFGYPDPTYLKRVKAELAAKGIR